MTQPLLPYAFFGALLAMAGLPIYIHAPKFYVDEYGVSLAAMGGVLFGLRLLDVVQDPALGWLSRRVGNARGISVVIAGTLMALAMIGLFAVTPPVHALVWFGLTLAILFSAFSFLTISFYAEGVETAKRMGENGHVRLAGWRETGAFLGVSIAAVAPVALAGLNNHPFALFAGLFAGFAIIAVYFMRREWRGDNGPQSSSMGKVLRDPLARRLLVIACLNAMPVAVSSTLFLFFVETRLAAPGWEGPLLLMFFLSAAVAAPFWSRLAQNIGTKNALILGMLLAILSFAGAAFLGAGDVLPFVVICLFSGFAIGADMTLLPALFAARSAEIAPEAAEGFGLWSFVSKISLAFAAVVLLPFLDVSGFEPGAQDQPERALAALTLSYAVVPCVLKLMAILLLTFTPLDMRPTSVLSRGT